MDNVVGKTFRDQTVVMDDKNYVQCTFQKCEIVYTGGDFSWVNSKFEDCKVTITGNAGKTLAFMQQFGILPRPNSGEGNSEAGKDPGTDTFH